MVIRFDAVLVVPHLWLLARKEGPHGEPPGADGLFDLEHDFAHVDEGGLEQEAREEGEEVAGDGVAEKDEDLKFKRRGWRTRNIPKNCLL